jgi:hypothetical protein
MSVYRTVLTLLACGTLAAGCVRQVAKEDIDTLPSGGRYLITMEELSRYSDESLYDAVRKLRPHFLRSRGVTAHGRESSAPLMLYVDGERMHGVDDLRRFSVKEVYEVRFYEPQLANTYFARYNNSGGAIAVALKPY